MARKKRETLKTVDAVIKAMGGNSRAAVLLGETPINVGMWLYRDRIPADQFLNVTSLLDEMGFVAAGKVFGMKDPVRRVA